MTPEEEARRIDDLVLALLYLNTSSDQHEARAWKTFPQESMDRLYARGLIGNPKTVAKSVVVTRDGAAQSAALFEKLIGSP